MSSWDEFQSAQDIGVTVFSHLAWGFWHQGYPDRTSKSADEARRLADGAVASIVSFAEMWACWTMLFSRRVGEAGDLANALVARATEHRMPMWSGFGLPLQGAVVSQRGDSKAAVEPIREGLSVLAAMGARYFEPFYLALLAEALAGAGEIDDGLNVLAKALVEAGHLPPMAVGIDRRHACQDPRANYFIPMLLTDVARSRRALSEDRPGYAIAPAGSLVASNPPAPPTKAGEFPPSPPPLLTHVEEFQSSRSRAVRKLSTTKSATSSPSR